MPAHNHCKRAEASPSARALATARLITWSIIGGLSLFFYFGVS